jgi:hypothetical protein
MADYAPNYTMRVKLRYSVQGRTHSIVVRGGITDVAINAPDLANSLMGFLNALAPMLYDDWTVVSLSYCLAGETFFVPMDFGGIDVFIGGADATALRTAAQAAIHGRFEGRGTEGSKAALVIFGVSTKPGDLGVEDYRIYKAESVEVEAAHNALVAAIPPFRCGNGSTAVWYPYMNIKANDAVVRDVRT